MELKPGYKQTEVGVIPEGWVVRRLSDLAKIRSGIAKNSNASLSNPVTVPYLRVANVQDGFLDLGEVSSISIGRDDLERYLLSPGDVLMNEGGDLDKLGRGAIWRGELNQCIHQNHVFAIRCTAALLPEFLNAWASGKAARRYFVVTGKQTTNLASINKTAIGGLPIALPSPREQQQIAEALGSLSAHEASFEDLIEKKKRIKQAAMQELLTGKRRLPGFEGEREVKRLGDLGEIKSGGTPSTSQSAFWDGGIPWCTPTDITALDGRKYLTTTARTISPAGLQGSSAETIPPYSLIMTTRATIGECAINAFPMTTNQGFKNIVPNSSVGTEFLYYLMTTQKQRLVSLCGGSTFLEIGKKELNAYEIRLPLNRDEQDAIASMLSGMDEELQALEASLAKVGNLKQGMLQQLLTGKIRLT